MNRPDEIANLTSRLSIAEQALWSLQRDDATAVDAVGRWATATESQLSTWTVIDGARRRVVETSGPEDGQLLEPATYSADRLASLPIVADSHRLGDGLLLLCRDHLEPYLVAVAPTRHKGVVTLITPLSWGDDRWQRFGRWVRSARFARVFLSEPDFRAIGDALEVAGGPIATSRLTARNLVDGSSYTRGWPASARTVRPSHTQVLAEARPHSVRTLTLQVGSSLYLQLRRAGGATYYRGSFELFRREVIDRMAEAAGERLNLLSGRERQVSHSPRPLVIQAHEGTFSAPEAIGELIATLGHSQDTGVAVFHRNPYLHAAVTDYSDGSTVDVFVNEADEVVVIPGYRATPAALARLTTAVGERFAAEDLKELPAPTPPTVEDLLHGLG